MSSDIPSPQQAYNLGTRVVPPEARDGWPKLSYRMGDTRTNAERAKLTDALKKTASDPLAQQFYERSTRAAQLWDEYESEAFRRAKQELGGDSQSVPPAIVQANQEGAIVAALEQMRDESHPLYTGFAEANRTAYDAFTSWRDKHWPEGTARRADDYAIHTGQEWSAVMHFADDGKKGRNISADERECVILHRRPGAPFSVQVALFDNEVSDGGPELLLRAAAQLDSDDALIWLYISHLLAPVEPLPPDTASVHWIDLDDVARKTLGGYAPNSVEAESRRRKVYQAVLMAARAEVRGQRSTTYFDKRTGEEIPTRIQTSLWKIFSKQQPVQPALFAEETVPVRVQLVASPDWTELTTRPDTAQWLPFAEVIGAIPGNKAGGAWARSLGLAYLFWCRSHLYEALEGQAPTRQFLFSYRTPKIAPPEEILNSMNPRRALHSWKSAEDDLRANGLIDAPPSSVKPPKRQDWKQDWMDACPTWKPGPRLRPVLEDLVQNKFAPAPRALQQPKRGRGRPRKTPNN